MTRWVCGALLVLFAATAVQVRAEGCLMYRKRRPVMVANPFGGGGAVLAQPGRVIRLQPLKDSDVPAKPSRRLRGVVAGGPAKPDLHGDPLPPGAVARYGTVRLRHGAEPDGLAFSSDGKVLGSVSATHDGVRLWDPATGKEVARLNSPVDRAAFARDGSVLVLAGGRCKHWVPAGNAVREFPEETVPENAACLAINPDL